MVEREAVDRNVAQRGTTQVDLAQDPEPPFVAFTVLGFDAVGVAVVQVTRRLALGDVTEGRRRFDCTGLDQVAPEQFLGSLQIARKQCQPLTF